MENFNWIFDGIGTAIIAFILGAITGGSITYKIVIRKQKVIKQKQKARNNAKLTQIGVKNGNQAKPKSWK